MSDKYKIYNPDLIDFKGVINDIEVLIPAKSYAIVSEQTAKYINQNYCAIEVTKSTEQEYKEYRKKAEAVKKELEAAKKAKLKQEAEDAKAEAERVEKKIAKREAKAKEIRKEKAQEKIAIIEAEKEAIKKVEKTTVVAHPKVANKTNKKGK